MLDSKTILQRMIRNLVKEQPFIGHLIQEMDISVTSSNQIPTACITYDKKNIKFKIFINSEFADKLTDEQRQGVLLHEIMHFEKGHLFRFEHFGTEEDHKKKNIAADMAINQFIPHLPDGCVKIDDWKQKDGTPFPKYLTTEAYFDLIKETTNKPSKGDKNKKDSGGNGADDGDGGEGDDSDSPDRKPTTQGGTGKSINYDKFKDYVPFDVHDWDELSEEEKRQLLQEAGKIAQRAVEKSSYDYSNLPDSVKSFIDDIEQRLKKLNYKAIFKYAVKKNMQSPDRVATWNKPNKRFDVYAPGAKYDRLPFINAYLDTSGSISHTEANQFLTIMNNLLGEGQMKKCNLGLWHTDLYLTRKYKKGTPFKPDEIEAGGTDPMCVFEHIQKNHPNLSIIFTDGYYGDTPVKISDKVIFIISEGGNKDHPYKNLGLTFGIEQLK